MRLSEKFCKVTFSVSKVLPTKLCGGNYELLYKIVPQNSIPLSHFFQEPVLVMLMEIHAKAVVDNFSISR